MLSTVPVTKLSMPMTLWPRAISKSVKCDPKNPAAPVTTEVNCFFFIESKWSVAGAAGHGKGNKMEGGDNNKTDAHLLCPRSGEHGWDGPQQYFKIEPQ